MSDDSDAPTGNGATEALYWRLKGRMQADLDRAMHRFEDQQGRTLGKLDERLRAVEDALPRSLEQRLQAVENAQAAQTSVRDLLRWQIPLGFAAVTVVLGLMNLLLRSSGK